MPSALQRVLSLSIGKEEVWVCWTNDTRMWLFTGQMSLPLSRERGAPVLTVNVYTENGDLQDVGDWTVNGEGKWQRYADCSR